jgi:hypothetical protein
MERAITERFKNFIRSLVDLGPELILGIYICWSTFPLLFEPYIQGDDGYYLGAARRVVQEGDQ